MALWFHWPRSGLLDHSPVTKRLIGPFCSHGNLENTWTWHKNGPMDSFLFLLENTATPINQYLWVFSRSPSHETALCFDLLVWEADGPRTQWSFLIAHDVLNYMSRYYVCFTEGKVLLAPLPKFRVKKNSKSANVHSQFTQGSPKLGTT